ncbi:SAPS-domain-containing protein [Thozetella sp. PMI_491]|nr:SAPS-domain-containing protein [Thozetella sp. PMI_491]
MFWRFGGYANISTIDTILDKDNFQLEDLLDESDLIQELKQHNAKLVEYLRDQPVLEKLLEYVVAPKLAPVATPEDDQEGDREEKGKGLSLPFSRPRASSSATDASSEQEESEKKRNKYAFVAAEILSSDNWSIYEALMESKALLRSFWQFLKLPAPLDPLQASYFTKVNESLFDKKTEEMIEFLKSIEGAIPDMIRHVDSPMIMDLLLKIISLERTESGQGIVEWLYTQDVIPTLLSFLGAEHSWSTQTSAGDFMKAIITVSANASQNEQTCIGPNELTRQLVSKPCVEQLVKYMLGGGNPLTVGVGIVIEVIRKNNSDYDPDTTTEADTCPSSRDPIYLGTLLRLFAQHVPDFMNLIMNAPAQKDRLDSTFGQKIEPLGFDRFKTCELMAELLHCSNMGLLNEPGAEELIAARDEERRRLRAEGTLHLNRGPQQVEVPEGLMMRMSHSSTDESTRRLEVTNSSAEDDGFEEVTHAGDDDGTHGVEDIPELPEAPANPPASSFLDKDEDDFVDEPLSSPRLNVRELDAEDEHRLDDPELMVPPLSPTKQKAVLAVEATEATTQDKETSEDTKTEEAKTEVPSTEVGDLSLEEKQPNVEADKGPGSETSEHSETPIMTPAASEPEQPVSQETDGEGKPDEEKAPSPERMSPHPEDKPAPLFSGSTEPAKAAPAEDSAAEAVSAEGAESEARITLDDALAGVGAGSFPAQFATHDHEPGSTSVIVDRGAGADDEEIDLTPPPRKPYITPVVGDFLKIQFVEHRVVPTILEFFFKYPWNNFLHNVVYDIVQQVFNGPMDRGYNPTLATSLFEAADVTTQIINGQQASEESQTKNKTRMGYMGHLTLIAEEVVKFTERHPPELLSETVVERVMAHDWINYVEGALAETRERDNAILGGVRPEVAMSNRAGTSGLAGVGLSGLGSLGFGGSGGGSNALAEAGLNGGSDLQEQSGGNGIGPFAISAGTLMSGFGSSSDEDEDEDQESEEDVNNEVSYPLERMLSGSVGGGSQRTNSVTENPDQEQEERPSGRQAHRFPIDE